MDALSRAIFYTYVFNVFIYCSIGYIHLLAISPHKSISLTRWYNGCVIMLKNEGRKCISTKARVITTLVWSDSNSLGFQISEHILLNFLEILITTMRGLGIKNPFNVNLEIFVALEHGNHATLTPQNSSS
jgi:hypothetical protein